MAIFDLEQGWLSDCEQQPSPHFNQRPDGAQVDLLVIHNISLPPGKFGSSDITDFFLGKLQVDKDPFFKQIETLKVSAHCLVAEMVILSNMYRLMTGRGMLGYQHLNNEKIVTIFLLALKWKGLIIYLIVVSNMRRWQN